MLKNCQNCHFENEEEAIFCAECGSKIDISKVKKPIKSLKEKNTFLYYQSLFIRFVSFFKSSYIEIFFATRFFSSPLFYLFRILFVIFIIMLVYTIMSEKVQNYHTVSIENLEFSKPKEDIQLSWKDAKKHCQSLEYAGKKDWRLPPKEELEALYHSQKAKTYYLSNNYWTNTQYQTDKLGAWRINFDNGEAGYYSIYCLEYVRCVRDK